MADVLEDLVVRLTGDGSAYKTMMDQVQDVTKKAMDQVTNATKTIDDFTRSVSSMAQNATRALAALGASAWLRQSLGEYQHAELAALKLNAAMEAQGRNVQKLTPIYDKFADAMQEATTAEDDNIRLMIAQAENMGLTADKAMRAVKNALALASKAGDAGSAAGFIRITASLEEGRVIARAINPALINIKDNTQRVAAAQDMLAKMFKTAEAAAQSSSGSIKQLSIAYGNMQESFGKVVAQGIKPVVDTLRDLIRWVEKLPQTTREAIVMVLAFSAGILALGPIVAGVTLLLASLFNPVVIGLGAAAAATILWVRSMGGVQKAMEYIKAAAYAMWDWILPVRQALESLWNQIAESGKGAWEYVKKAAEDAWNWIVSKTGLSWTDIRGKIVDAILFAEFTLTHFKEVADTVWAGMMYGIEAFRGRWMYLWDTVIPAGLDWLQNNWNTIWEAITKYSITVLHIATLTWKRLIVDSGIQAAIEKPFEAAFGYVYNQGSKIVARIARLDFGMKFSDLWKKRPMIKPGEAAPGLEAELEKITKIGEEARKKLTTLKIPEYVETGYEKYLKAEFERLKGIVGVSFAEFREKKLREFAKAGFIPDPKKEAADKFGAAGTAAAKAFKSGMDSVSFALSGSFEALKNLEEYATKLAEAREAADKAHKGSELGGGGEEGTGGAGGAGLAGIPGLGGAGGGVGGVGLPSPSVTPSPAPSPATTESSGEKLLREIRDLLANIDKKGGSPLKPVDVAGTSSFAV